MSVRRLNKLKFIVGCATAALFVSLLFPIGIAAKSSLDSPGDQGTILIIASYNPDTRRMSSFISDFEHKIANENVPFEILIEDLGCKSVAEANLWKDRLISVLERYDRNRLKAVILLGQEAWASFVSLDSFPQDIPFFGCYASTNGIPLPDRNRPVTDKWMPESVDMIRQADSIGNGGGSLNRYDIAKNIDLIRSLYPNVDNIAFLSDNTYGGISLQALVKQEMSSHPDLTLTLIDGRNGEKKAYAAIERLPRKSVLLIGTWREGQDGQYFMDNSLKTLLADQPHLPVFSVSGSGIGSGAIGGYIPKYENGASEIAGQIADFYKKKPRAVHFDPTENEYRFDLQKLKEFGIAEYKLPSGSIVVDTVEARLQKYESYILILIIIFIVLSLFIAFLYYLYYRNKKLKISLENRGRELIAAKEKAEESDMLKSAFLANMSHEIRTPLNAIVGFSALLGDESISEEDRNVYMGIVNQNSDLLLTLIGDILDISRLETGKISFTLHPENIVAICQQVISTTAHGRKKGVECVFNPPVESFILKTDSQRLSQVLINLISNARKFTKSGSIVFGYELRGDEIYFFVKDTGMGISPEGQTRLFQRFVKLNDFMPGNGLGLSICKGIVEKMNGSIGVESAGEGKGSTFWFKIPYLPAKIVKAEQVVVETPKVPLGRKNITILVAEDCESNFLLFQSILKTEYKLIHAWNGREAVALCREHSPQLIIMDINMPNMDGYEATREIRKFSKTVPIIAVTAYAFASDKEKILKNGFNGYVAKPINPTKLGIEIRTMLNKNFTLI